MGLKNIHQHRPFYLHSLEELSKQYRFPDPYKTVHEKQNFIELDLFSENPVVIAEVKTFKYQKQFDKLQVFAKKPIYKSLNEYPAADDSRARQLGLVRDLLNMKMQNPKYQDLVSAYQKLMIIFLYLKIPPILLT